MNNQLLILLILLRTCIFHGFIFERPLVGRSKRIKFIVKTKVSDNNDDVGSSFDSVSRRALLSCPLLLIQPPQAVNANSEKLDGPNLDSLTDLPPITEGCVRIYLCRHGQTENNRLRKVQGARVDPPLNDNGVQQAMNLGKALARIDPKPDAFFASNLHRARMTSEIAASQVDSRIKVQQLLSLGEVDFGPIAEGQPVALATAGMQSTYVRWATGQIDYRPEGGDGESGREVITRASAAMKALALAAASNDRGTCVAVTHSTFLRILLAVTTEMPLLEAASVDVVNGGVTVFDVPRDLQTRILQGRLSKLFSGYSGADVELEVPVCHVVRINESRHLPTVPMLV